VIGQNMSLLVHDDRFTSVQLQSLANAQKPTGQQESSQPSANGSQNGKEPQLAKPAA